MERFYRDKTRAAFHRKKKTGLLNNLYSNSRWSSSTQSQYTKRTLQHLWGKCCNFTCNRVRVLKVHFFPVSAGGTLRFLCLCHFKKTFFKYVFFQCKSSSSTSEWLRKKEPEPPSTGAACASLRLLNQTWGWLLIMKYIPSTSEAGVLQPGGRRPGSPFGSGDWMDVSTLHVGTLNQKRTEGRRPWPMNSGGI